MQVRVNNLTFAYTQKLILNDVSFNLESGEFLTLSAKRNRKKHLNQMPVKDFEGA